MDRENDKEMAMHNERGRERDKEMNRDIDRSREMGVGGIGARVR